MLKAVLQASLIGRCWKDSLPSHHNQSDDDRNVRRHVIAAPPDILRSQLSQQKVPIAGSTDNDRLVPGREPYVVHRALVSGQLVNKFRALTLPHTYTAISTSYPDPLALAVPARSHEVTFNAYWGTRVLFETTVDRRKRFNVPCPGRTVVRVAEQRLRVWRDREGCDGVRMADL